ncbi:MAG: polysaccharide deacetylase family protein [Bacteroidota bacterium]
MYLVKTPAIIQKLFPNFHWRVPGEQKTIYLTFDDGPVPSVTPWVLRQLKAYDAQATFFCVGENAQRHPDLLRDVYAAGHTVGNHSMSHLDGWATENLPYFHDVRHCAEQIDSTLFRPPYGRLRPRQAQFLQRHYEIVMWDVLSGDFDPHLAPEACLRNVLRNAKAGSIVVFHDSLKAKETLEFVLPQVLSYYADEGFQFKALTPELLRRERPLNSLPQLRTA